MNSFSFFLLLSLQCLTSGPVKQANQLQIPESRYIVQIADERYDDFVEQLADMSFTLTRLHPGADLYRFRLQANADIDLGKMLTSGIINGWQHDRPVIPRNTPDDPLFPEQWDMMRIGMEEAWDQTTGGVTINGDTIVVAILDTGYDLDHEDLSTNYWHNSGEIPGDLIDNDQNGYVDDYLGLNIQTGDDMHEADLHGTAVAGIIGAVGGNGKGVAGVNWHVKLLLISGIRNESDIIEGYMYIKELRETYNGSGGSEGAFVVVANLSVGIDNAFPADHMMWCNQYEAMGSAGILGVCATTNTNSDVDMFGDMPTTCPSNFMISVTNTGKDDNKLMFAGFGKTHIDLGAPGTPTLTTELANGYKDFIGTSAAAPHVAGSVALLYAIACHDIADLATTEPDIVALQMRNLVLDFTQPVSALMPLTVSGGRLSVKNAVDAVDMLCGNTGGELGIVEITPNPFTEFGTVVYRIPTISAHEVLIYDSAGRLLRKEHPKAVIPGLQTFTITNSSFPPGVYHFTVRQGGSQVTRSFMIF